MAGETARVDLTSSDEASSPEAQPKQPSGKVATTNAIKDYVTDMLTKHGKSKGQPIDLSQTEVQVETATTGSRDYDGTSAFRRYPLAHDAARRTGSHQSTEGGSLSSDDELRSRLSTDKSADLTQSVSELNLDPNPIHEERESLEQTYKQIVYLRQLQPPTPQPVEIQVQEVLISQQAQKPPLHVRVGQREPKTPPPIVIKSQPPQPPPATTAEPIIYNKYVPLATEAPQQIVIHRYPDLPPKPRPIIVEQWLPYKPAPKRIIKHSLPRDENQQQPSPHNIIYSYSKPRALVQVEYVRLPVVKVDPQAYEQMSAAGQDELMRNPLFQHEQSYLSAHRSSRAAQDGKQMNWRI